MKGLVGRPGQAGRFGPASQGEHQPPTRREAAFAACVRSLEMISTTAAAAPETTRLGFVTQLTEREMAGRLIACARIRPAESSGLRAMPGRTVTISVAATISHTAESVSTSSLGLRIKPAAAA